MEVFDLAPVKFEEEEMLVLDQTKLPAEEVYIKMETKEDVWDAIHTLKVRGAPAIGVAAAYGLYVSTRDFAGTRVKEFREYVRETSAYLNTCKTDGGQSFVGTETLRGHAGQIYFGV